MMPNVAGERSTKTQMVVYTVLTAAVAVGPYFTGLAGIGYGLFAAVSYDEGKTWPDRRLITPGGPIREVNTINRSTFTLSDTMAEPQGYLAITQSRDHRIQLITSKNHYAFNLAWLKQLPSAPKQ